MAERIWVYLAFCIVLLLLALFYSLSRIQTMRLLGCNVLSVCICAFFLAVLFAEFILPAPQYYISARDPRYGGNLNKILEQEVRNAGIGYEEGSFRILESDSMHLHHLFLCSYRMDGHDEARIFRLEKNIFGNMKPAEPFVKAYIIPQDGNPNHFYFDLVEDGFFGTYLVQAGYAPEDTVVESRVANAFHIDALHVQGYFLASELAYETWKLHLLRGISIFLPLFFFVLKKGSEKFYTGWKKGDKLFQIQYIDKEQTS